MTDGRYIYCVMDQPLSSKTNSVEQEQEMYRFGNIGIGNRPVYTVNYKDMAAAVSSVPFKEITSTLDDVIAHQRVVEAARAMATVLPVRFGVIVKTDQGVKTLLAASYADFRSKLTKFAGMDEMGVKVLLDKSKAEKMVSLAESDSDEIKQLREQISSSSAGASHFLKMKLQDAIRNETMRKIDQVAGKINQELAPAASDSCILKNDIEQIILNAAYLVDRSKVSNFNSKLSRLREEYEPKGFTIHVSGPWAPYSFC
jgi:hypothetical protein